MYSGLWTGAWYRCGLPTTDTALGQQFNYWDAGGELVRAKIPMGRLDGTACSGPVGLLGLDKSASERDGVRRTVRWPKGGRRLFWLRRRPLKA